GGGVAAGGGAGGPPGPGGVPPGGAGGTLGGPRCPAGGGGGRPRVCPRKERAKDPYAKKSAPGGGGVVRRVVAPDPRRPPGRQGDPPVNRCPSQEQLARLLAEALEADERAPVEEHVERCSPCQEALEQLTSSGIPTAVTGAGAQPGDTETSPFLDRLQGK